MSTPEKNLSVISSIAEKEYLRVVDEDSSKNISVKNFVSSIRSALIDEGFITSSLVTQTRKILEVSDNYLIAQDNEIINVDASAKDITISLPDSQLIYNSSTRQTRLYQIKKTDASEDFVVKVTATGEDTVDGDKTITLIGPHRPFFNIYAGPNNSWWSI